MDMTLFIKLMGMTTSSHDGEALVAIRKANAMLVNDNLNWEEFFTKLAQVDNSYRVPPSQRKGASQPGAANPYQAASSSNHFTDADEINAMFDNAFAGAKGSFAKFLDSIHDWWEEKGFLTAKQYEALKKAAQ